MLTTVKEIDRQENQRRMEVASEENYIVKEGKVNRLKLRLCHRVFFNEVCDSDFTIISAEGYAFPCHTAILSSECEVFSTMFQINWIEVSTTRLALQDMSTEGVDAFLRYLYLKDTLKPRKKLSVAVELYLASHKYMLHDFCKEMKKILLGRHQLEWYSDLDSCIELYRLTSVIAEKRMKARLLRIFKKSDHSVQNRYKIRNLCCSDPSLAAALLWDCFEICTCSSEPHFESEGSESDSASVEDEDDD